MLLHNGVCTQAVSSSVIVLKEVRTGGCLVGGELLHCSTILQQGRIREVHGFVEDQTWMPGVIGSLPAYSIIDFTYKNERLKTHLKLYVIYMKHIEAVILSFNLKVHVTHMTR